MAKIVITSTPKTVKVAFNDYSEKVGLKCGSYLRNEISEVNEHHNADHLTVVMLDGSDFDLSFDSHSYALKVDSIDGVTPADNDDLFTKLVALQEV